MFLRKAWGIRENKGKGEIHFLVRGPFSCMQNMSIPVC